MFCNNCGNQIQEGERFCVKCGAEVAQNEPVLCEKCGAEIKEGAKFCNACGAPVAGQKEMFCQFCGQKFEEGEMFCKKCGNKLSAKGGVRPVRSAAPQGGAYNRPARSSSNGLLEVFTDKMAIKHFILAGMILFLLIFSLVPALKLEIPVLSWFSDDSDYLKVTMINPIANLDELDSSFEDIAVVGVLGAIFEVLILLGLIALAIMPVFRKTLYKRRRFVLHMILSIGRFFSAIGLTVILNIAVKEEVSKKASADITFGGVMYIIFALAIFIFSIYMCVENKKVAQDQGRINNAPEPARYNPNFR